MRTRKNIRLPEYDYRDANYYFITICCEKRKCMFGSVIDGKIHLNSLGMLIQNELAKLNKHPSAIVDTQIIMPNHIHLILYLENLHLPKIIQLFKASTKKSACEHFNSHLTLWQRGYYEHIIRNERSLSILREYIVNNPVQWEVDRENPKFHD